MKPGLDEDGQPHPSLYQDRVSRRLVSELLGVCKGMVCDGVITEGEAHGLRRWIQGNPDAAVQYPGNVLADRLGRIFADGHVDEEERQDLLELLRELTGDTAEMDQPQNLTTNMPFDTPPPTIIFDRQEFVFTGKMLYGTRRQCERAVADRGGRAHDNVRQATSFVVVGPIGSAAWLESTHGRKILRAVELRSQGLPVKIVPEEEWVLALDF